MIRDGNISREEGIVLVEQYDGVCDDSIIEKYCSYVNISREEFWKIASKWINKSIFDIKSSQRPVRLFEIGSDYHG